MRTNRLILILTVIVAGMMASCDSYKGKVEDLATQFVTAYNEGDKAAVYDIWPEVKTLENLSISGTIGDGNDVSVEKDDSTGNYIATISELKKQRLVFSVDSTGNVGITDAYGVFRLDSIASEVALKAGVPLKKLSDVTLSNLMNPNSDFVNDLKLEKGTNNLWANYGAYSWGHNSSGYYASMDFNVRNNSSHLVKGSDYFLVVTPKRESTGETYNTKTVDGIDIAPGEIREFNVSAPSFYSFASKRDLSYKVEIKYRTESILAFLLNYSTFEGNEYEDYMAHPCRAKVKANGKFLTTSAEKKGIAYAYKEMSEKSPVVDTLYHRQQIQAIWETETWASIYDNNYALIGYVNRDNIDTTGELLALDLTPAKLKSDDGSPVKVFKLYDDGVVKTYPPGTEVYLQFYSRGQMVVYERQADGSMKEIGYVTSDCIDYGDDEAL